MQGANFEEAGAASAGEEACAGYLGEDREFHPGRVVSLAAFVWQVQGKALSGSAGGCGIAVVVGVNGVSEWGQRKRRDKPAWK